MPKRRKPRTGVSADAATARAAARQADIDAGIRRRPVTYPNRRNLARRVACRGRVTRED